MPSDAATICQYSEALFAWPLGWVCKISWSLHSSSGVQDNLQQAGEDRECERLAGERERERREFVGLAIFRHVASRHYVPWRLMCRVTLPFRKVIKNEIRARAQHIYRSTHKLV